jgi:hypothetical protein
MKGRTASNLATRCAAGSRGTRRQAAYRFYRELGVDDEARHQLVANYGIESSETYRKLVTTDAEIVRRIGIWTVLRSAPSIYWRRRAIEHFLDDENCLKAIAETYPDEVLWAIRTLKRSDLATFVLRIFREHRGDPYLVNCAIQCLSTLGDATALAEAVQAGRLLLADDSGSNNDLP